MNLEKLKGQMIDQIKKELDEQREKVYDRLEEVESQITEIDFTELIHQVDSNSSDIEEIEREILSHSKRLDDLYERQEELEERF